METKERVVVTSRTKIPEYEMTARLSEYFSQNQVKSIIETCLSEGQYESADRKFAIFHDGATGLYTAIAPMEEYGRLTDKVEPRQFDHYEVELLRLYRFSNGDCLSDAEIETIKQSYQQVTADERIIYKVFRDVVDKFRKMPIEEVLS